MASRPEAPLALVSAVGWRVLIAAALGLLLVQLLLATRHYASALLIGGAAALLLFDAAGLLARGRRGTAAMPDASRADATQLAQATALLDAVTVALFVLAPDGRIRFANRAARQLAGGEAARLQDAAALGPEAAARILALPVGGRQLVPLPDGREMLAWVGGFATPDAAGQRLVSLQAVAGELDAVQVGAWHAMTRVLAHEMMNALTPVASLSESLARIVSGRDGGGEEAAAAETIARQSRHLMRFVERYRSIVNLPEPAPEAIALQPFLADLDALGGGALRARGVAFSVERCAAELLRADPTLLRQALLNLVRNAGEAAAQMPSPEVRLACRREGGEIRFEIADNGPGVPPERMEEIFVPFFTTKEGGAGIGLTLARQVALAHGGRLAAAPGGTQGMIFTLALPG